MKCSKCAKEKDADLYATRPPIRAIQGALLGPLGIVIGGFVGLVEASMKSCKCDD